MVGSTSTCRAWENTSIPSVRAFSILEAFVVVFLLGVITSIAVPRVANFLAHQRLDGAARRVAVDLALARREARFTGASHRIVFNLNGDYRMQSYQDSSWKPVPHPDHPGQPYVVDLRDEPYQATISEADFGGDLGIIFDGYGVPDSDGYLILSAGKYSRKINLNGETGLVDVP